jgi:hypothetical protein
MQLIISKQIQSRSFDILFETVMYVYRSGLTISEVPITYTFSNSSLNSRVVKDCLTICFRVLLERKNSHISVKVCLRILFRTLHCM